MSEEESSSGWIEFPARDMGEICVRLIDRRMKDEEEEEEGECH